MDILANLINSTFVFATALILGALGGMIGEKVGVISLGVEGFMVSGAFFTAIGTYYAESMGLGSISPWIGIFIAFIMTGIFSYLHAIATLKYKADHVISGVVINLLVPNVTFFLVKILFEGAAQTPRISNMLTRIHIPVLSDIPFIGKAFFNSYPTTYLTILLVIAIWYVFYKTPTGLRLRAIGENPGAVDTAGVNVYRIKFWTVMLSGSISALGGAVLVLTSNSYFSFNTIAGQGYIAIAAVILGRWNPYGVLFGGLLFGAAQSLSDQFQIFEFSNAVPTELFYMLPYVITLVALVLTSRQKGKAPAALGSHYESSDG